MNKKRSVFIAIITALLALGLCFTLYQLDNKYTKDHLQPINGILYYEETEECTYLIRQWLTYPDVFLTPKEADTYSGYRCYQDVGGKRNRISDTTTYRLTMILPDNSKEYALEIHDIFSSCEVFINGKSVLKMGEPNPDHYQSGIGNRVITFTAQGETDLLICSTDYSGIQKGIVYPPSFGLAEQVSRARELRLLTHAVFVILALSCIILAVTIGMLRNKTEGILILFMALCVIVTTGYPLYHGFFITDIQPWYTIEPLCFYGIFFVALLLFGYIFEISPSKRRILILPCLIGAVTTFIRFGLASFLPPSMAEIFSVISLFLKYYTAFCLLCLGIWALYHNKYHSLLLLCGAVTFAVCLICDRIIPLYEPVYGGWLGEIGGILLTAMLSAALWIDAVRAYRFRLTYETNLQQQNKRLEMQREHYEQLSHQIRLVKEASHDLRHHIHTLRTFTEQEQWDHLKHYLRELEGHIDERNITFRAENPVADAVLNYYATTAEKNGIEYNVRMGIPAEISFPEDELCILLSNLLENAIDAMLSENGSQKQIYLRGELKENRLGIVAENTYSGKILRKHDRFLSTKHPERGYGLSSVTTIVEKHKGMIEFETQNNLFRIMILIPLKNNAIFQSRS